MKSTLRFNSTLSLLLSGLFIFGSAQSQIYPDGAAPTSITYDTMVIGNGNNTFNLSLPKFDIALGTLFSAKVTTKEGLKYTYALVNADVIEHSYLTRVIRMLYVTSDAMVSGDIAYSKQETPTNFTIPASSQIVRGPIYMTYTSNYMVPVEDITNFMGTGNVDYSLVNVTAASVEGPTPWNLNFQTISDTTRFSITYTYCATSILPLKLNHFKANRISSSAVNVEYSVPDAGSQSTYFLEQRINDKSYKEVLALGSVSATANSIVYANAPEESFVLRIKQVKASGAVSYSSLREIAAFDKQGAVDLFPNPATNMVHINIPANEKGAYKVSIMSLHGQPALQMLFAHGGVKNISLPSSMVRGLYLVETMNTTNGNRYVSKLSVK